MDKVKIVNGWTISKRGDEWQAVCKGEIGIRNENESTVREWARYNAPGKKK